MKNKMVLVEWEDIITSSGAWACVDSMRPVKITSIGHLVYDGKSHIVICQGLTPEKVDEVLSPVAIPKGCILKVRTIKG